MTEPRKVVIGDAELWLGDAAEVLPQIGKLDAIVTDPPYGINHARDRHSEQWGWRDYPSNGWDQQRPPQELVAQILAQARHVVIWGGNYFADQLPPSSKWLVWDKCQTDFSLADAELAWCSFDGAVRRINYPRARALQDGKEHPTQKPVDVMVWCLRQLPDGVATVCDPFAGSGTTGVACARLGMRFIGIEREPHYFDVAARRIEDAQKQGDLLRDIPARAKPTQGAMPI